MNWQVKINKKTLKVKSSKISFSLILLSFIFIVCEETLFLSKPFSLLSLGYLIFISFISWKVIEIGLITRWNLIDLGLEAFMFYL